ncbi:MAG: FHA domain-containing protein, partial [Acidimicrobiia bacterium]|nr:FHA domain-containing protein [Acidimicrobiia bacterium]
VNRSVVGRSAAADVHLPDDDVSRQHALVWREAGAVWLVDLGSSNGTYVNGERVVDVIDLLDGDRLAFGAATFHLRIH